MADEPTLGDLVIAERDLLRHADEPRFVTYQMADGDLVYGEFSFVTGLEWFDDRDGEIRLIKRTYLLVSEEEVVLPDPYPIEDEEDEEDEGDSALRVCLACGEQGVPWGADRCNLCGEEQVEPFRQGWDH